MNLLDKGFIYKRLYDDKIKKLKGKIKSKVEKHSGSFFFLPDTAKVTKVITLMILN